MREIIINENDAGQRVDKFLTKLLPSMPKSLLYKQLRKKRIKRNKKALGPQDILAAGDVLFLYVSDEFFTGQKADAPAPAPSPVIVYEDESLLICDKPAGQPSHGSGDSLLAGIQYYLYQKGAYDPAQEQSFRPALSNRLDRNTRGLVLAAKNAACLRALNEKIKNGDIIKTYLAVANGHIPQKKGRLTSYLLADAKENRVHIVSQKTLGAKLAVTDYEVLRTGKGLSLLRLTLLTGRKHQIRVQLAEAGHPLLGDTKYGAPKDARFSYQALCACRLFFNFTDEDGPLHNVAGKTIDIEANDFFQNIL